MGLRQEAEWYSGLLDVVKSDGQGSAIDVRHGPGRREKRPTTAKQHEWAVVWKFSNKTKGLMWDL